MSDKPSMTERLTQAVSSTLGGLTGQEAEDKFTSTSGAPLAGVPTKDVPSAGPNATAGPGAISGPPSSGVSFTVGGQGTTGAVSGPEEVIKNLEERVHKDSPVAVLGSGEHVKATGGTNEVGEPMVKDDQGTNWRASPATHS